MIGRHKSLDDVIEIPIRPCNTVGPMDKTADEVPTLGRVNRVSVEKCQFGKSFFVLLLQKGA